MKVIVASSSLWPTPNLASMVLSIMASTDEQTSFAIRAEAHGTPASAVEDMVKKIGERIGRAIITYCTTTGGRRATFSRDISMVDPADFVYAFFAPGELMAGGTGHVVNCALRRGIAVQAFELDDTGNVVEVGSDQGDLSRRLSELYEDAEW